MSILHDYWREASTMGPDQPAGYFSTFSIIDLSRGTLEGLGRPQRRNRRVFVCIPCHRRKLKCDKSQPCARCIQSGTADECVYQQFPPGSRQNSSTDSGKTPQHSTQPSPQPTPAAVVSEREPQLNGVTHWSTIAFEVREKNKEHHCHRTSDVASMGSQSSTIQTNTSCHSFARAGRISPEPTPSGSQHIARSKITSTYLPLFPGSISPLETLLHPTKVEITSSNVYRAAMSSTS